MGRKFPSPTSTSTSTTTSPLKHPPPTPERPTIATTTTATITTKNKNGHGRSSSTINTPNATKGIKIPPLNPLPPKFRKLSLTDTGTVTLQDGSTIILQGVAPTAWRESSIDDDFLVLGVEQGQGDAAVSMADFPLGVLRCRRWLACARNKLWWMTPEWGVSGRELPPETQFLLMELEGGEYVIMLPLIDSDTFRGTLRPPRYVVLLCQHFHFLLLFLSFYIVVVVFFTCVITQHCTALHYTPSSLGMFLEILHGQIRRKRRDRFIPLHKRLHLSLQPTPRVLCRQQRYPPIP